MNLSISIIFCYFVPLSSDVAAFLSYSVQRLSKHRIMMYYFTFCTKIIHTQVKKWGERLCEAALDLMSLFPSELSGVSGLGQ